MDNNSSLQPINNENITVVSQTQFSKSNQGFLSKMEKKVIY